MSRSVGLPAIEILPAGHRPPPSSGAITEWCHSCNEHVVAMRNGTCGWCDTLLPTFHTKRQETPTSVERIDKTLPPMPPPRMLVPQAVSSTSILVHGKLERLVADPLDVKVRVSRDGWDRVILRNRRQRSLLADCLHYLTHPSDDLIRRGALADRIREMIEE